MSTTSTILSIREIIDIAFGNSDVNIVNHKLIQTILYLLARQLRVLERKVEIEMGLITSIPEESLSVTEIKVHAMTQRQKPKKGMTGGKPTSQPKSKQVPSKTGALKPVIGNINEDLSSSSDKTKSTTEKPDHTKTLSDQKSSSDKTEKINVGNEKKFTPTSTDKSLSSKVKKVPGKQPLKDTRKYLEMVEEARETEIRIIHQRSHSKELPERTPTPIASLDSVETTFERLLVGKIKLHFDSRINQPFNVTPTAKLFFSVERVPSDEVKSMIEKSHKGTPRISLVTQDQFVELATAVQNLQKCFAPIAPPGFPENIQFLQDLRKGASLTDAMAALQLSARLEAAEKTIFNMLGLITELATQSGIDLSKIAEGALPVEVKSGIQNTDQKLKLKQSVPPVEESSDESQKIAILEKSLKVEDLPPDVEIKIENAVTNLELEIATKSLYDEIMKNLTSITEKSIENADYAFRTASKLESRLAASLNLGDKMEDLEARVSNYAAQINILDTTLSSQMTNYQEQLTQMQHDLETSLETMAEALANTGGDTTAITELNTNFTSLQTEFDNMAQKQKELKNVQSALTYDLEALWKEIEHLKATKSDRDEVTDALRDKVGIGALNGLVSIPQFDAVRGDYEKRIGAAYNKFNNQEIIWQKAIDDILREFSEKADLFQLLTLKEDITKNLNMLHSRINAMMEIVGEPRAASVTRKLHRDATCLSCSSPAHMVLEESRIVPALPKFQVARPPTIGAETQIPKEDGDHICYPGQPISHPIDPRAYVCNRYCGGSHTTVKHTLSKAPAGMIIRPIFRETATRIGTDGRTYITDELHAPKPCVVCNTPKTPEPAVSQSVESKNAVNAYDIDSDMVPPDYREISEIILQPEDSMSLTPPAPFENLV